MKHFNIKMAVMFVCMTLGFAGTAKGQIYSDEALFYIKAGESLLSNPSVTYVYVDNSTNKIFVMFTRLNYIEKKGFAYYDNPETVRKWNSTKYECTYSEKMSRSDKNVYLHYSYGLAHIYVISDDKSSLVAFPRGDESRKEQYILIDRSKLNIKQDSDYDFLYE